MICHLLQDITIFLYLILILVNCIWLKYTKNIPFKIEMSIFKKENKSPKGVKSLALAYVEFFSRWFLFRSSDWHHGSFIC